MLPIIKFLLDCFEKILDTALFRFSSREIVETFFPIAHAISDRDLPEIVKAEINTLSRRVR